MNTVKTLLLAVVLLGVVAFLGCSSDTPNRSDNTPKDYVVYGWNYESKPPYCVGYHTLTGVIDSLPLPTTNPWNLKVSPDGNRLYIARSDRVSVLDVASREVILDLPYASVDHILFSPDGSKMALFPGGLRILRTSDYSVLYHNPVGTYGGVFSNDGEFFYCQPGESLTCVRLGSGSILWRRNVPFYLGSSWEISKDDSRIAGLLRGRLRVYDIRGDSLLFDRRLSYSEGDMKASPDGTRIYLTAAGDIDFAPAPFTFAVYDLTLNKMLDSVRIPMVESDLCHGSDYVPGEDLAVTPDAHLFASAAHYSIGEETWEGLVVYNLARPDTAKWICTRQAWRYLTCQINP